MQLDASLRGRMARRPQLYGTLVVAGVFLVAIGLGTLAGQALAASASDEVRGTAGRLGADVVATACVVWLLSRWGWWRAVGFGGPSTWRSLHLLAFPAVLAAVSLVAGLVAVDSGEPARLVLGLPEMLLTGFWEEGLTRGLLLSLVLVVALRSAGNPIRGVLLAGAIFGALHLVNIVGGDVVAVLVQVVYATLIGVAFGALLLRTNALWLLVAIHSLINSGTYLRGDSDGGETLTGILILSTVPLVIYGLYLLRRVKGSDASSA